MKDGALGIGVGPLEHVPDEREVLRDLGGRFPTLERRRCEAATGRLVRLVLRKRGRDDVQLHVAKRAEEPAHLLGERAPIL